MRPADLMQLSTLLLLGMTARDAIDPGVPIDSGTMITDLENQYIDLDRQTAHKALRRMLRDGLITCVGQGYVQGARIWPTRVFRLTDRGRAMHDARRRVLLNLLHEPPTGPVLAIFDPELQDLTP